MEINELNEKCFMHDEIIKDIAYDKERNTLKMELEFCEWQLKELNKKYKGMKLTFGNVEQVLSYTIINKLLEDERVQEIINKYIDITLDNLTSEEIKNIDIESDIINYINENKRIFIKL